MGKARKSVGWALLALIVLAMLTGGLSALYLWNRLEQNGIEALEWQGLSVSFGGIAVRELAFTQSTPEREVNLQARNLSLGWHWPDRGRGWQPQLTALKAGYLALDLYVEPAAQTPSERQQPSQWLANILPWLPADVSVQQFDVTLPCESGRCPLKGSLAISSSQTDPVSGAGSDVTSLLVASGKLPVKTRLQFDRDGHHLGVSAMLDSSGRDTLNLKADVSIDGRQYLSASSDYSADNTNGLVLWQGSVDVPELPRTDWLLAWLQTWQNIPMEQWPDQPDTGSVAANWQLQGPGDKSFLASATGRMKLHASISQPWPAPGIGRISGNAEVTLEADQGLWRPETLQADAELTHPAPWIKNIPELMRPDAIKLSVRPAKAVTPIPTGQAFAQAEPEQAPLPLNLEVTSRGGANIAISSHLAVSTKPPWRLQLGSTELKAALPRLKLAGWQLTKPELKASLTGWLDFNTAMLTFGKTALVHAEKLESLPGTTTATADNILITGLSVDLSGATLNGGYSAEKGGLDRLALAGPLEVKAKKVRHPQLQPHSWQFDGRLAANLDRTDVEGVLKAKTGTSMNLDLTFPYQGLLSLEANMRVSGESEAEALSRLFTAWPEVLLVSGGNLSANATYEQAHNGAMRLSGKLVFADWSGTYDRTAWSRINGSAELLLEDERVRVTTPELTIEEVNPGLPVGPMRLAGHYEAPMGQLAAGLLTLEQASSDALGGQIIVQPGRWDLAQAPVKVPVELKQLSLARLLQLYPAEGLAGTGILSGTVPVLFDPATGIRVERGRIDALKPGGRLKVAADRLKALASQSESMELIARALEDFRYSVLDSGIDYDENGTLTLKLHLEGNSPEVGKGQPVVLNINLEENIPALLTSLQLSGRVSDAVAERVKKLLKNRERDSGDLLE